jgi:hypothetical protein
MRLLFDSSRSHVRALLLATSLTWLYGCAQPLRLNIASSPTTKNLAAAPSDAVSVGPAPATVQIRYFTFSPSVSVVAWDPAENGFGLRAAIGRNGSIIRDHRIFVSTYYDPAVRAFPNAAVASTKLLLTGVSHDLYACYFGDCSPAETFGARIPDELLRAHRDSVPVTFYARGGRALTLTVHRAVIDSYLAAVDSVRAALRRRH